MNVKKCFAYVLVLFCISVSFAFVFPVSSFADYEEDETVVEEEQEELEEEFPLLTSEVPNVNDELANSINNLVSKIDGLIYSVDNIVLTELSFSVIDKTLFENQFYIVEGYQDYYDNCLSYYDVYKAYTIDTQFLAGTTLTLADIGDIGASYIMISPSTFSIIYWDYIFEGNYEFYFDEDCYLFIVSPVDIIPSSVGTETLSTLYVTSKVDEDLLNDISDMSNKLDILQIDIYLLKNAVSVIGFILLFSVMYPLLTSITHKFMGRKD